MKLKKVLCMAALSVAVALTGISASGAVEVVHAEETQFSNLDEILRTMYAYYTNGDYASMYALDTNETTAAYVEAIRNSGSDRYVIDLDGSTKAMLYVSQDGGYWWYFGQMENNLRQGNGTTIVLGSYGPYTAELFTGSYAADFPNGTGKLSSINNNGGTFNISGIFQGAFLNGGYQVDANWVSDGVTYSSSRPMFYSNNRVTDVDTGQDDEGLWEIEKEDGEYLINNPMDIGGLFTVELPAEQELFAVGFCGNWYDGPYWCCISKSSAELDAGLSVFQGNTTASVAAAPSPATAAPAPAAPEETAPAVDPTVPAAPTATPSETYTVERGDYLCRIAQKVYGDSKLWRRIFDANSDVIKDDYIIWTNQVLVIPSL